MNLLNNTELVRVAGAQAAAQTEVTSDVIDMAGYDGVTFIVSVQSMVDTAKLVATAQGGEQADGSDAADLEASASFTASGASAGDDKLMAVEVFRPRQRYVRLKVARSVANSTLDGISALKAKPAEAPVTQGATVAASSTNLSPASA